MPLSVYSDMHAVTKQSVQGQLVAPGEKTSPLQTLDESVPK
jgi:hypothetical protein